MGIFDQRESNSDELVKEQEGIRTDDYLETYHNEYKAIQDEVNTSKVVSEEEIENVKRRVLSSVTGNSYLADTYQKEYPVLKEFDFPGKYKDLIERLNNAKTYQELEQLKIESDKLKENMYSSYKLAQKGTVEELQQAEAAGIVARNKRQLELELERDSYQANTYQKKYEYFKVLDYVSQYEQMTLRLKEVTTIEEVDNIRRDIKDLREKMEKDAKQAPYEEAMLKQQKELSAIYDQLLQEDFNLICHWLGYDKESKSALKVYNKGKEDYNAMLVSQGEDVSRLYKKRDIYLLGNIKKAFFLKCLAVDAKLHKMTGDERKAKYEAYAKKEFKYSKKVESRIREKLSAKYLQREIPLPIWLLEDKEIIATFKETLSVESRVRNARG